MVLVCPGYSQPLVHLMLGTPISWFQCVLGTPDSGLYQCWVLLGTIWGRSGYSQGSFVQVQVLPASFMACFRCSQGQSGPSLGTPRHDLGQIWVLPGSTMAWSGYSQGQSETDLGTPRVNLGQIWVFPGFILGPPWVLPG